MAYIDVDLGVITDARRRQHRRRLYVVGALLFAVALGTAIAWAQSRDASAPHTGGVAAPALATGTVLFANGQIPEVGVPNSGLVPARYAKVLITGKTTSGNAIRRRVTTHANGRFSLVLSPGQYRLLATVTSPAASLPLDARGSVTVPPAGTVPPIRLTAPNPYVQ